MKENKFRVWASNDAYPNGKMYLPEENPDFVLNLHGDLVKSVSKGNFESVNTWARISFNEISVMQAIGLTDKNGKEIYEDDICRILYSDWPSNSNPDISLEDYLISISSVGNIEYNEYSYSIMLLDRYGDRLPQHLSYGKHGFIEVIGNIHENPELL